LRLASELQIGTKGVVGEMLFHNRGANSATRKARMFTDSLQNVDEIGVGIDSLQPTGRDQASE
jgi:hypothetical protein